MQPCTNCDGKCNTAADVIVTASTVIVIEQYELVIVIVKTK